MNVNKMTRFGFRRSATALLLVGCLTSAQVFGQEIFRWVDEEGVTHFGHAATARDKAYPQNSQTRPKLSSAVEVTAKVEPGSAKPAASFDRVAATRSVRYADRKL